MLYLQNHNVHKSTHTQTKQTKRSGFLESEFQIPIIIIIHPSVVGKRASKNWPGEKSPVTQCLLRWESWVDVIAVLTGHSSSQRASWPGGWGVGGGAVGLGPLGPRAWAVCVRRGWCPAAIDYRRAETRAVNRSIRIPPVPKIHHQGGSPLIRLCPTP